MIKLTEFDKYKAKGFIYETNNKYKDAIACFNKALKIKEDGQIYYVLSLCYCHKKDYKTGQEYALKAIQAGYDAYELYNRITVGNLAKVHDSVKVLEEGVKKQFPSACIALADLHLNNNLEPDMVDPLKAAEYLELAYEYAKPEERSDIAIALYERYKNIYKISSYYQSVFKENRELKYLKIVDSLGGRVVPPAHFNYIMFDILEEHEDYDVIQSLFNRFDDDAKLIFGLFLLEEEYERFGTIVVDNTSIPFLAFYKGSKNNNGACYMMLALAYSSDFIGVRDNKRFASRLMNASKKYGVYIPKHFKPLVAELFTHYDDGPSKYKC